MKSIKPFFGAILALSLFFCLHTASAANSQTSVVKEVLTGDTVRLAGGKTLKYAAVAAPPLQSIIPLLRQYGEASKEFNRQLVEGKTVRMEWGPKLRDEHGNLLAYVYLEDGAFVNDELIKAGHAKQRSLPPNTQHSGLFRRSELNARRDRLGLWKDEPENPYLKSEYLGDKNTKIFYFPTSPELERIPESYLVKFRTKIDAKAAGYRPCATCKESAEQLY